VDWLQASLAPTLSLTSTHSDGPRWATGQLSPGLHSSPAVGTITQNDYAVLTAAGVQSSTLHSGASVVGVAEATTNDTAGTWQPTPGGQKLYEVACGERGPHNIGWRRVDDLCAFSMSSPARLNSWLFTTGQEPDRVK